MKKQTGIWIDSTKAVVVTLNGKDETTTEVLGDIENRIYHRDEGNKGSFMGDHHINSERKFDERIEHQTNTYLKDVLNKIKDVDEIYIFGPAEIKLKLRKKIEEDKHISFKLKAVEASDNMTINQIVAKTKEFFHS